jgi:pimeloyl-ACP methyl ester carboxylesterase
MGGAISLQLVLTDTNKLLQNLVLIGTGAKLKVAPLFIELSEKDFNKALQLMSDFGYNKSTKQEIKEKNEKILRRTGSEVLLNDFKACNIFDVRNDISSIYTPTLIICGENDMMTPCRFSSYMHEKIKDSELTIIPDTGHFVFLESPDKVNEIIKEFLQRKS